MGGYSLSGISGNKTSLGFGGYDFWVLRLDQDGNVLWDRSFGGDGPDELSSLQETSDGGFILGGSSRSGISGNKSSPAVSGWDYWLVRLDQDGNKLWDKAFDHVGGDDHCNSLQQTSDGGFILGGSSAAPPDPLGSTFAPDFWVLRLDSNGEKLWDRPFGGSGDDTLYSLSQTRDGGFILGGTSDSGMDGSKTTSNLGGHDFWVLRLDPEGKELWEQTYGGIREEEIRSIRQTSDGGFILGGWSTSFLDAPSNCFKNYQADFWVIKLGPEPLTLRSPRQLGTNLQQAGFQLLLTGVSNSYVIDFSTNLIDWVPLQTNTLRTNGGLLQIRDESAANARQRFYRSRGWP